MYKAIVIDDEPLARTLIQHFLQTHTTIDIVGNCGNGFEAVKMIQELQPDLIFLDVQMPKLTGFEMLELLDDKPSVIFTTAFDEYAVKAFDAHAVDYLLKPITQERFDKAIEKWLQTAGKPSHKEEDFQGMPALEGYKHRIVVKDQTRIRIIPEADIHYLEADDDYVRIHCKEGVFIKKITMRQLGHSLDPKQFVRIHRSYIIPLRQLSKIEPYEKDGHIALLQCGVRLAISKSGYVRMKEVLGW